MEQNDQQSQLIKKAAAYLFNYIKRYQFDGINEILNSEFPVDYSITDTDMSALSMICTMPDRTPQEKQYNQQLLETICQYLPNFNQADKFQRTPLHLAASAQNLTAVEFLLQVGSMPNQQQIGQNYIDFDAQTTGGETPLMKAAQSGNLQIVIQILRAGCNPFLEDNQGLRADHHAERNHPTLEIHVILRNYIQEIEESNLEDINSSVTAGGPNEGGLNANENQPQNLSNQNPDQEMN